MVRVVSRQRENRKTRVRDKETETEVDEEKQGDDANTRTATILKTAKSPYLGNVLVASVHRRLMANTFELFACGSLWGVPTVLESALGLQFQQCLIETEELIKGTGNHVHHISGNISKTAQDRDIIGTDH